MDNFKSWKELKPIRLGRVTLLFGENSSGKSSIIQMLLLIKQTAESFDRAQPLHLGSAESLVELGLFDDIVYEHQVVKNPLKLHLEWTPDNYEQLDEEMKLDVEFKYITDMIRVTKLQFEFLVDPHIKTVDPELIENAKLTRSTKGGYELEIEGKKIEQLGVTRELAPVKFYGFPSKATSMFPGLNTLSYSVDKLASDIHYIGPLRQIAKREYAWSGSSPDGVGRSGENAIQAILANIIERRSWRKAEKEKTMSLSDSTGEWLKRMGLIDSFEIKNVGGRQYKAVVTVPGSLTKVNVADVGIGVSQVLPIVVLAYFVPEGSIIILEQPELHLHPSVQAKLGEFFFEVSSERNIQFIVETHSEHLLTRLQRKVAERGPDDLTEKDVQLYFSKYSQGKSSIDNLKIDDTGKITNWPTNFFGDTTSDREAIMKAIIRKKKQLASSENKSNAERE